MLAPYDPAIDLLLSRGADVDQRLPNGSTPLLLASIRALAPAVSKLLKAGADPNIPDADGHTPLMVAARGGFVDVLRKLLLAGAKQEARDAQKRTALWYAHSLLFTHLLFTLTPRLLISPLLTLPLLIFPRPRSPPLLHRYATKYEQRAAAVMLRQAREGAQLAAKAEKPGGRRATTKKRW